MSHGLCYCAACEQLRTDAARYRWLRENCLKGEGRLVWYLPRNVPLDAKGLDANIDEAIATRSGAKR